MDDVPLTNEDAAVTSRAVVLEPKHTGVSCRSESHPIHSEDVGWVRALPDLNAVHFHSQALVALASQAINLRNASAIVDCLDCL